MPKGGPCPVGKAAARLDAEVDELMLIFDLVQAATCGLRHARGSGGTPPPGVKLQGRLSRNVGVSGDMTSPQPGPGAQSLSAIAISVDGLSAAYAGKTVLDNLTLEIRRGSSFALLGPN